MEEDKSQSHCFALLQLLSTWLVLQSLFFFVPPMDSPNSCAAAASSTATDKLALLSFKSLMTNDPTGALLSWNDSLHFCDWQGVSCGDQQHPQRVTALNLDSSSLAGTISPYISNLTWLTWLRLSNNTIHGRIPQEIGNLSQLQHLSLSTNFLEGEIPSNLSHCTDLRIISIFDNMLQGEIPPALSRCSQLTAINFGSNKLVGEIPSQLWTLPRLSYLILGYNNLTGYIPTALGNLSSLIYLHLSANSLSGGLPHSVANLSSLGFLGISENGLSGDIPPSLTDLSSLYRLDLSINFLSGGIPSSIGKLSSLIDLDLSYNQLSGFIPSSLYNLSRLSHLDLSSNKLVGTLQSDLGHSLSGLHWLNVRSNQLDGSIPISLTNASGLKSIQLQQNSFRGTIPSDLGALPNLLWLTMYNNQLEASKPSDWTFLSDLTNCSSLRTLDLSNNILGGMLPNSIANLSTSIYWLNLEYNKITGSLHAGIGNLVNLTVLDLGSNLLTGPLPVTIGELHQLSTLELSKNRFTGEIPLSIGNLTRLNRLYLASNGLRGRIPAILGNCRSLELLDLSSNQLTGTIPKELVTISSLSSYLRLDSNLLVGPLPPEVDSLQNLNELNVSNNKLSGEIPSSLGECVVMEDLRLRGNHFVGAIPLSLSKLKGLQALDLSENNLSGYIPNFLESFLFLEYLNLSVNNFEGEVPINGIFGNVTAASVLGNTKLCGGITGLHLPPCSIRNTGKKHNFLTVTVAALVPIIALCYILGFCLFANYRHMEKSKMIPASISSLKEPHVKVSYFDLVKATDGFSSLGLIGVGNFGFVYKGIMHSANKRVVAVKVLNLQQQGASNSFTAECEALKNIRHRNLVRILTSCSTADSEGNDFKALVYEFMPNGSLENWLHPEADETHQVRKLSLVQRLSIATDVASALEYLHHHAHKPIAHCDLKPSNVLLDDDMTAHVGDFGLARFLSQTFIDQASSASLRGSIGYIAPEYGVGCQASTQGDVYSYGILLLEMFTGKRPTDDTFKEGMDLHKFVETAFPEKIMSIVDPRLFLPDEDQEAMQNMEDVRIHECLASVIRIGLFCSKRVPRERMRMDDVAKQMWSLRDIFLRYSIHGSRQCIA